MKIRLVPLLVICSFMMVGLDGLWVAEVQGPGGPQRQTLTLECNGDTLTGTLENPRGRGEISEGIVHGNEIVFKLVRQNRQGTVEQNIRGTLSGDELTLFQEGRGQGRVFKRAR